MDSSSVSDETSELDSYGSSSGRKTTDFGSVDYSRTISEISSYSEVADEQTCSFDTQSSGWQPASKAAGRIPPSFARSTAVLGKKAVYEDKPHSEVEMVKDRFAKLLLGEDMSGGGKGVCSAVALSNAITNLYATVFGHYYKLEPLPLEKKIIWKREMDCLLSVCVHIVEFFPSTQTLPDGSTLDVMETRPRRDIHMNLPALEKLDNMLIDMMDSFQKSEFWYQGKKSVSASSKSFRKIVERDDEKWWLPVPSVPASGLSDKARKELQQKRDCGNQIHKAAMAINAGVLAEMEVPESYLAALSKSGRVNIGDAIYRSICSTEFSPDGLLDSLDISSEHEVLEIADRIEAAMNVWRRKASTQTSKSSWEMVKDLVADDNKSQNLANRAENLLILLKQRYQGLSQTTLDTSKIQFNKDVGQAILESYSRVLESLAFNLVSWIDDVLFVDHSVRKHLESKRSLRDS